MRSQPVKLTYEIDLQSGELLNLPPELTASIGAGRWLVTIQPVLSPTVSLPTKRDGEITKMSDWNVVVNLYEKSFKKAFKELQGFGLVNQTDFFNVLTLKVSDIDRFLETFQNWISEHPNLMNKIARAVPVTATFTFQSSEEFEAKAKEIVLQWVPQLGGKTFHVRMHRRGFKGRLSSNDEERFLDWVILQALEAAGTPGSITFDDPDAIIVVETLGREAGLSCWMREQLQRYSFLKLD